MRKLNNKGYLLVEIIVSFALAISIMYIISQITVTIKNKNDDLMVSMLATVDQTIIYNMIMGDVYEGNAYKCNGVDINKKKITYSEKIYIVSDYVNLKKDCTKTPNTISLTVPNLSGFDVVIP